MFAGTITDRLHRRPGITPSSTILVTVCRDTPSILAAWVTFIHFWDSPITLSLRCDFPRLGVLNVSTCVLVLGVLLVGVRWVCVKFFVLVCVSWVRFVVGVG